MLVLRRHVSKAIDRESLIYQACVWEATARKPGNVHPSARFVDVCWDDFIRSAQAVAPVLARTAELGVGPAILEAVAGTQRAVGFNTNLGIILLLAPLAAVPKGTPLREGIRTVLQGLTRDDAIAAYEAIRLAKPGGLGEAQAEDVANIPTGTLRDVMGLAADRDQIAAAYTTDFARVFQFAKALTGHWPMQSELADEQRPSSLPHSLTPSLPIPVEQAIIRLHLSLLADEPDTLIARKCGTAIAQEASTRARDVLNAGWPIGQPAESKLVEFDQWLRADGHRRNPGTTADFVAACLFVALANATR